jgi:hypothetical protein
LDGFRNKLFADRDACPDRSQSVTGSNNGSGPIDDRAVARGKIKSLMAALKRRRRIFAVTSLLVLMLILPGSVLFVIPGFAS